MCILVGMCKTGCMHPLIDLHLRVVLHFVYRKEECSYRILIKILIVFQYSIIFNIKKLSMVKMPSLLLFDNLIIAILSKSQILGILGKQFGHCKCCSKGSHLDPFYLKTLKTVFLACKANTAQLLLYSRLYNPNLFLWEN